MTHQIRICPLTLALTLIFLVLHTPAQAALNLMSVTHTQNFDFLSSSTSPVTWVDNQATQDSMGSPGWYWFGSLSTYLVDDGNDPGGGRFSYGSVASGDRAMGGKTTTTSFENVWGLVIRNALSETIIGLEISFTGEKWRDGNAASDSITFSYKTSSANITDFETASVLPSGWTAVPELDFTTTDVPDFIGSVNGNDSANRTTLTHSLLLSVPVGEYVALRWYDDTATGAGDPGIAIDDLTVTAAVPEPAAVLSGSLICGAAAIAAIIRRWRANLDAGTKAA